MTKEEVIALAKSFEHRAPEDKEMVEGEEEIIFALLRGEVTATAAGKVLQVLHKRSSITLSTRFQRVLTDAFKNGRLIIKD